MPPECKPPLLSEECQKQFIHETAVNVTHTVASTGVDITLIALAAMGFFIAVTIGVLVAIRMIAKLT